MGNTTEKIPTCNSLNPETIKTSGPKSPGEMHLDLYTINNHFFSGDANVDHNEDIFRRNSSRRSSHVVRRSGSYEKAGFYNTDIFGGRTEPSPKRNLPSLPSPPMEQMQMIPLISYHDNPTECTIEERDRVYNQKSQNSLNISD